MAELMEMDDELQFEESVADLPVEKRQEILLLVNSGYSRKAIARQTLTPVATIEHLVANRLSLLVESDNDEEDDEDDQGSDEEPQYSDVSETSFTKTPPNNETTESKQPSEPASEAKETPEALILRLFDEGLPQKTIMERAGKSYTTVCKVVGAAGKSFADRLSRQPRNPRKASQRERMPTPRVQEDIVELFDKDYPLDRIAKRLKTAENTVRYVLFMRGKITGSSLRATPAQREAIRTLYNQGQSMGSIAEQLGITLSLVSREIFLQSASRTNPEIPAEIDADANNSAALHAKESVVDVSILPTHRATVAVETIPLSLAPASKHRVPIDESSTVEGSDCLQVYLESVYGPLVNNDNSNTVPTAIETVTTEATNRADLDPGCKVSQFTAAAMDNIPVIVADMAVSPVTAVTDLDDGPSVRESTIEITGDLSITIDPMECAVTDAVVNADSDAPSTSQVTDQDDLPTGLDPVLAPLVEPRVIDAEIPIKSGDLLVTESSEEFVSSLWTGAVPIPDVTTGQADAFETRADAVRVCSNGEDGAKPLDAGWLEKEAICEDAARMESAEAYIRLYSAVMFDYNIEALTNEHPSDVAAAIGHGTDQNGVAAYQVLQDNAAGRCDNVAAKQCLDDTFATTAVGVPRSDCLNISDIAADFALLYQYVSTPAIADEADKMTSECVTRTFGNENYSLAISGKETETTHDIPAKYRCDLCQFYSVDETLFVSHLLNQNHALLAAHQVVLRCSGCTFQTRQPKKMAGHVATYQFHAVSNETHRHAIIAVD
ncbi:uncharacterized protein LOC129590584 [Paramacrobiotus metropolitanus]|uniref:uncharacterized protein LOC129590584 n=1 Tax=Paramacrobiotus metropolitanus TaxID=2943436 RepID=UPI0024465614|nr:uncharacterized protein LOC129590584 [Paramacrobiotus metropolitanus]